MKIKKEKKLYIKTYGCQMNVYDTERIIDVLKLCDFYITDNLYEADMIILNTCHIREKAEQKVYSELGRLKKEKLDKKIEKNEDLIIVVAGCVAQAEGEEVLRQAPYVDLVLGPQSYHKLPDLILQVYRKKNNQMDNNLGCGIIDINFPIESKFDYLPKRNESNISAFLTVQEGCNKFCSFCCVPYTRGAEYSRPVLDILKEAKELIEKGSIEITLLGQNVNAYQAESPRKNGKLWGLGDLIQELALIQKLKSIRYTTSHPSDVSKDLIEAHKNVSKLMPFLHLPVQSGSDSILKSMNRRYTSNEYLELIDKLKKAQPKMAFSSDFIVGYPGETDRDFEDTLSLINKVKYAQAYSFKYSPRPGTPAAYKAKQVPEHVKSNRLDLIQSIINQHQFDFNKSFIGMTQKVLIYNRSIRNQNKLFGKTIYMQSTYVNNINKHKLLNDNLSGKILDIKIKEAYNRGLLGELINSENYE